MTTLEYGHQKIITFDTHYISGVYENLKDNLPPNHRIVALNVTPTKQHTYQVYIVLEPLIRQEEK